MCAFVYPPRHTDGIQADVLKPSGNSPGICKGQTALDEFIGRKTTENRIICSHILLDAGYDFQQHLASGRQITPIGIGTLIGIGGEELVNEVAMGSMDFDTVKACLSCTVRCLHKCFDNLSDFVY